MIEEILAQPLKFWFNRLKQEFEEYGDKFHFVFPQYFIFLEAAVYYPVSKEF